MKRHHVLCATATAICAVATLPAQAQVRSFEVAAQPVETAIRTFGRQADVQILAARRITKGKSANGLRGNLTVEQALQRLLQGTGLTTLRTGPRTYTVVTASGMALPVLMSPAASYTAESQSGQPSAAAALATEQQSDGPPAIAAASQPEADVVVTGSRIARNGFSASTPVVSTLR